MAATNPKEMIAASAVICISRVIFASWVGLVACSKSGVDRRLEQLDAETSCDIRRMPSEKVAAPQRDTQTTESRTGITATVLEINRLLNTPLNFQSRMTHHQHEDKLLSYWDRINSKQHCSHA